MSDRLIFHVDVNSAFLSWTATKMVQEGKEDLRLVPSIIGGDPSSRTSIVAAKSIPAKAYGITTGEPVSMAVRKCPGLIVAKGDFKLYKKYSQAFKAICQEYTPLMESFSIDEVFLDMSGMSKIYPDPIATAYEIKDRIREELGFTVNIGIGENKLCAKMASDFTKPDRVHTLFPDEIETKMWPLPVRELFCCGKASAARLQSFQIQTIGDLAHMDLWQLKQLVGEKQGASLYEHANGRDTSPVNPEPEDAKGYSVETTMEDDLIDFETADRMLLELSDVVATRLRKDEVKCRCVAVSYRGIDFKNRSHQCKLAASTNITSVIYETACKLLRESWACEPLRLIGVALTDIDRDGFEQMSFLVDKRQEKMKKLDQTLDSIRGRFGNASVKRASTIKGEDRIGQKFKQQEQTRKERQNSESTHNS